MQKETTDAIAPKFAAYRCGEAVIDPVNRRFSRGQQLVELEPKVFSLILQLLARPNELITRDELLDAVWGHRYVTPSSLNRAVGLARKAFSSDRDATFIQTVHGSGYRYIGPITAIASVGAEGATIPRALFAPPVTARMPARLDEIIGRENEIAQIGNLLTAYRAVTVLGAGGMGKTQCAVEFARRNSSRYPDGVWFYDLAYMTHGAEWLESLAHSMSISTQDESDLMAKVAAELSQRNALLLLDNCDRISTEVGAIVVEILRRTDWVRVLATSQQRLGFVGERILHIRSLMVPSAEENDFSQIAASPAVALLLLRITATASTYELTDRNALPVAAICRKLDGIPLALELAAPRFALLSADQVLERLDNRFRFLVGDVAGRDRRHQTLVALIEWSYALLSADEQRLLCWLSVFSQGWTAAIADELAAAMRITGENVIDFLSGLVGKSLIVVDSTMDPPRYRLLESIREFALDTLVSRGEDRLARDAHLACMLRMARRVRVDMLTAKMSRCVAELKFEHSNIGLALDWAQRHAHQDAAREIVGSLLLYIKSHGAMVEGKAWTEAMLTTSMNVPSSMYARGLLARGIVEMHLAPSGTESAVWLKRACQMAKESGDGWTLACAAGYHAMALSNRGFSELAGEFAEEAKLLAEGLRDDWLRGLAGQATAWIHMDRGDLFDAIATLKSVRYLGDDLHQQHFIDMYIGLNSYALGDWRGAATSWREAMRNALLVSHVRGVAGSIEGCAYLCAQHGRLAQASRFMAVAAAARLRTKGPLFRFWLTHHEAVQMIVTEGLRANEHSLPVDKFPVRFEDAANEAYKTLEEF